ncbi:hypothetical protein [Corynebacterium sp.]|uniref:hypothetical protein n=1 Tax=Corynebacterium sp. TaxID=1720 RepID=UPI0025BD662A|nr:hypothetical protein [Corynebacterium sp.]
MSDTLKLYPPPQGGRWEVEEERYRFCRAKLIIRDPGFFGSEHEVDYECVSTLKTDIELERKRIKAVDEGDYWTAKYTNSTVPRTEDEMDKAIWEASREIVRKYNSKRRPHEYVTEWGNA